MFNLFIDRPILSLVISIIITLLGVLALLTLPISQFPDIVPPSVTVEAKYQGANAEVGTKAVAIPLERAINGVPDMTYMQTVANNAGKVKIEVFFKTGTNPDIAAVNVQNRVNTILNELPEEVIKGGVTTEKEVNSMLMYLNIMSSDPTANEEFVYNFADINILNELKRIDGVGYVEIMGAKDYAMRIWLKPDRMLAYNVSPEEVSNAINAANIEAAPGRTGESSGKNENVFQYILRYTGKFSEPKQFRNIIIRANTDGSLLRLKDVADVEFGALTYSRISKTDGRPSASIMIKQLPNSNAKEVIDNIKAKMVELEEERFPPGMEYNITYDVSRFLDASLHEVMKTLIEAFILVFIVIFLFLQDFRSTIIPALAVPVALIGSLFFMQLLGFSINLLTLFALVLAIGIVVDNAIVVVEAVHVKMEHDNLSPVDATKAAMKEIGAAVIAITLVMSAVFIPVAFMSGTAGIFYRQFSLTLAIAIAISGVNALTLTPALCALILKKPDHQRPRKNLISRFFTGFNRVYSSGEQKYSSLVSRLAGRRLVTVILFLCVCTGTWFIARVLPGGFIPTEDQGVLYVNVSGPQGSTLERTERVLDAVQEIASDIDAIQSISTLAGYSLVNDVPGASFGMGMINLNSWDDRDLSVWEVKQLLEERAGVINDAEIQFFPPPTVPGFGNSSGFELRLLETRSGTNLQQADRVVKDFVSSLNETQEISGAYTSYDVNFPQYMIHIDQEIAATKGVSVEDAMFMLQSTFGSYYSSNFIRFGQMYRVMIQASPEFRVQPNDLEKLYVKNRFGEMVPMSNFIRLERVFGPEQMTRYNMYNSALVSGSSSDGYSSGDVVKKVEEVANQQLPAGYGFAWTGITREEIESGNQAIFIFLISVVFVYLLLAAQYESFLLPFVVILSLPAGILGAFLLLKVTGLENNIYAQVALVMLIGLLGKNAILIVEVANQRLQEGFPILKAAVEGASSRLRPILMTSLAFIFGLLPLCFASGAGALGNRSIGTAAAGGMLIGTIVGVILVPGLFVLFASMGKRRTIVVENVDTVSKEVEHHE